MSVGRRLALDKERWGQARNSQVVAKIHFLKRGKKEGSSILAILM